MKAIFKDIDKVINREIDKYTCPFCNRSLDVYSGIGNTGGAVDCYECNWRVNKYAFLINNKHYKLHSSLPIMNRFNISFNLQDYHNMFYEEEKFEINYFINYYLSYSENLIFM